MSVKRDAIWTGLDTMVSQGLSFLFRLSLAKLLAPEQFGIIAMTLTTVGILQVISDFGLTAALIQKEAEVFDETVVNSVFSISVVVSVVLFVANWLVIAPLSAQFFNVPAVAPLTAVVGISLLFAPIASVCRALLYRDLQFKTVTIARFATTLISLILGFAVLFVWRSAWAFAVQVVVSQALLSVSLLPFSKWRPRLRLNRKSLKEIFGYSSLVFLNDLAVTLARNLDVMIIGRLLTPVDVGLYALAFFLTDTVRQNLMSVLNRVMFVHYSKAQNDKSTLRANYLRTVQWNCRSLFPLMTCIALFGPTLAEHAFGPAWKGMGPILQLLSVAVMIHAAGGTSSTLYKAIGRPGLDLAVFLATTAFILVPAMALGAMTNGMQGVALAVVGAKLITVIIRQILLDRLVGSTLFRVMKLLAVNLTMQLPIVLVWLAGLFLWPSGSWRRDLTLGALCLAVYGAHIALSELQLGKRLWPRTT